MGTAGTTLLKGNCFWASQEESTEAAWLMEQTTGNWAIWANLWCQWAPLHCKQRYEHRWVLGWISGRICCAAQSVSSWQQRSQLNPTLRSKLTKNTGQWNPQAHYSLTMRYGNIPAQFSQHKCAPSYQIQYHRTAKFCSSWLLTSELSSHLSLNA